MAGKKSAAKSRAAAPAKEAKVEKPKEKKGDEFIDRIISPLGQWWGYIKSNIVRCYVALLSIGLFEVAAVVGLFILAIVAVLVFVFVSQFVVLPDMDPAALMGIITIVSIILYIAFWLFYLWLRETIQCTATVFIDSQFSGKPFGIIAAIGAIKGKVFRFLITDILLKVALVLPVIAVIVLLVTLVIPGGDFPSAPPATKIIVLVVFALAIVYLVLAFILYLFFLQFWRYGFLVGGMGVIDSLKQSISLVKRRPLETFMFDIIVILATSLLRIPLVFVYFGAYFGLFFVIIFMMISPLLGFAVELLGILLIGIVALLITSLAQCFWLPTHYLFWKRIREGG